MERADVDVWLLPRPTVLPPLTWLDDVERARAASLPTGRAAAFVAARRLLRAVVGHRLGVRPGEVTLEARCTTCGGPHGQVRVGPAGAGAGPWHVSLTRSGPLIAVAVADRPVGVDVESVDAVNAAPLADVVLSAAEHAHHLRLPPDARAGHLLRTWVRKEAALKAFGTGLTIEPSSLTVDHAGRVAIAAADPAALPGASAAAGGAVVTDLRLGVEVGGAVAVVGLAEIVVRERDGAREVTP